MTQQFTPPETPRNVCQECGWWIGPLEYTMVGDDKIHTVNYCSGCGTHIDEALP